MLPLLVCLLQPSFLASHRQHGCKVDRTVRTGRMWKQGSERVSTPAAGHPGELAGLSLDNMISKAGNTNIVY